MGQSKSFQRPKGTRDFLPEAMAVRRTIEQAWHDAGRCHGFDEVDGPTFEHLELYTVKSGEGIVSELFSFNRAGGDTDFALRPEFTPTLARMAAGLGKSMAVPTKWYAMPDLFRAERPQRGRLREHRQWNVDCIGLPGPDADAEVIAVALAALRSLGLGPGDVRVRISHRGAAAAMLGAIGVGAEEMEAAFALVDKREKLPPEVFREQARAAGLDAAAVDKLDELAAVRLCATEDPVTIADAHGLPEASVEPLRALRAELDKRGVADFCDWDLGIVRGLAYYTGTVWEIHDIGGNERAIAGGGRYDGLVSMFGGPDTPACGFGMGDVVLHLLLQDRGLLGEPGALLPRPDVFVISSGTGAAEARFIPLATQLRDSGLHVRHTYKAGRNVGKQLREASACRARQVVILGDELDENVVVVKDLDAGDQQTVPLADLVVSLQRAAC